MMSRCERIVRSASTYTVMLCHVFAPSVVHAWSIAWESAASTTECSVEDCEANRGDIMSKLSPARPRKFRLAPQTRWCSACHDDPKQALFITHPTNGITYHTPILLEKPGRRYTDADLHHIELAA